MDNIDNPIIELPIDALHQHQHQNQQILLGEDEDPLKMPQYQIYDPNQLYGNQDLD